MNREELIKKYLPLVNSIATRVFERVRSSGISIDELISAGYLGLLDAVNRFNPSKENSFEFFAKLRIRGAIYDYLRSLDFMGKTRRKKYKEILKSYDDLAKRFGREPDIEEVREKFNLSEEEFQEILIDGVISDLVSLSEPLFGNGEDETLIDIVGVLEEPEEELEKEEFFKELVRAFERLDERERLVLTLYYYEGFTMKEIARMLDISESRVSQIHYRAIKKLRQHMIERGFLEND